MSKKDIISDFDLVSAETKNNAKTDSRIILYCRISNPSQNIERQVRNLKEKFPHGTVVKEVFTGTRLDRPRWEAVMRLVKRKQVDTIAFDSVSRMSRDKEEGSRLYFELYRKGINLFFLKRTAYKY